MKKRLLAMLMVLMLVVSLLPVGVLAVEDANIIRLMNRDEWRSSTLERARVSEGNDVDIQQIFLYDESHNLLHMGGASGVSGSNGGWFRTLIGTPGINTDSIDKIILLFTYTVYGELTKTVAAVFDKEDFDVGDSGGVEGTRYVEINLTEEGKTVPDGNPVNFYAAIGDRTDYVLYDTVYVNSGETIGSEMPATPDTGEYHFVGWQTKLDGSGKALFSDTVITEPWTVYGAKVSVEGGTQYHVMKNSTGGKVNALNAKLAELDGGGVDANSFHITAMRVNDATGNHTNEHYNGNHWEDTYFQLWNNSAEDPLNPDSPDSNTRIVVEDVVSLTVYGTIGSTEGETFEIEIPRSDLEFQRVSDEIIEIKIRDDKVNEPEPGPGPDEPSAPDVVNVFGTNVVVDCVNTEVEHNDAVYALKDGFYSEKQGVTAGANGTYTYVITVDAQEYCDYYSSTPHSLADDQDANIDVTFTWADDAWTCDYGSANQLVIEVVCETPEVNYNGSHITIAVRLDGETVNAEDYITVERYTSDPVYNHFIRVTDVSDNYKNMLVYDFDVADYGINYYLDCTSIKVNVKGDYIVQGISSNQSYGTGGSQNVTENADGSYIVYNVADGVGDIDATIYLCTKYDVEYYVDEEPYENDNNVYVKSYGVSVTSGSIEPNQQDKSMYWKNPDCSNEIKLIDLPDNAEGWYAYNTGDPLTGTVKVKYHLPTGNSTTIKFYANTKEVPETTEYLAGFFVLMPEKMTEDFQPGDVYPTDSYYPNADGDSVTTASNPDGRVDDTTGYIGYLTEAGYEYFKEQAGEDYPGEPGSVRVTIPTDMANAYLIFPQGEELGTVWDKYLKEGQYQLVCYQINNSTLGVNWPSITEKDGTRYETYDGETFHVDCYIQGVAIAVTYDANYDGGTIYKHDKVNNVEIRTGDSYTVLSDTEVGFSREGYTFKGWSTSKDGDVIYTAGQIINPIMTDTILYAVWEEDESQTEDPTSPGEADLGKLSVILDCTNETAGHDNMDFPMNTGNSTVKIESVGGTYICTVTPNYTFILDIYNEQVADGHTYADDAERTLLLSWNPVTKAWDVAGAPSITRQVECETPEQPNVYKINVTVHNGTATFYGSKVTSHIPAAENEDITITFTPDEGYTLDYATIDGNTLLIPDGGVYTLKQVNSDHTIEVFYAEDELGGGDDGDEPDGTPDYRQVFVKYVAADGNGFVTPSFDTFNLEVDENGKVMTNVALSLKGEATPNADATFAYWTIDGLGYYGGAYSYEADLSGKGFTGYVAGKTYTFTAHFNGPVVKPELKPYNINVEVVNGTAEFKDTNIGANSVINVYPIKDDNKNVEITFVPTDGYVFDAAYVDDESITLSKDNSYTFKEVTADVTIKVLFKQDSVPITPVTPMPTPGEISDLIKDKVVVDCVNDEMNHGDKAYGLLDDALVRIEKTDDTTVKVTLDATVYQARYNTDTATKHRLADGQSATVTFALNYVDQKWRVAEGELPITIKVVCETPVEPEPTPDPAITGFSKTLVKDRNLYVYQGLAYPTFYRGSVIVDEGDGVTLLYKITVKGTPGTEFTVRDDSADFAQTGEIPDSGETSFYVTKTFSWRDVRNAGDTLDNTASVSVGGETVKTDTERVPVDIDWDINVPDIDDDDDTVYVPNWLNTTDHYAYIVGYEDGTIRPQNNITRAEVSTIFFRLLTDNARARYWSQTNDYTDVAADSWYNNAVSTLSNMGIINGYEDGTFKPNASITRAEFTAIATRFFDYEAEYDGAFNDVSARAWYADYVQAAVDMGLVDGYPDGGFHPNSNITRAEAVTIVNRVLNRAPHEDHLLDEDEMNVWPDNVYGAWYYADMQEATNSHDYDWIRVSGERVEEWTEKLPERDWAALEQEWSSSHDA